MSIDNAVVYSEKDKDYVVKAICQKCGSEWVPRGGKFPKICPYCSSNTWTQPKRS